MAFIKQEINPTNTIIDIIETEKVVDLREYVENKKNEPSQYRSQNGVWRMSKPIKIYLSQR